MGKFFVRKLLIREIKFREWKFTRERNIISL